MWCWYICNCNIYTEPCVERWTVKQHAKLKSCAKKNNIFYCVCTETIRSLLSFGLVYSLFWSFDFISYENSFAQNNNNNRVTGNCHTCTHSTIPQTNERNFIFFFCDRDAAIFYVKFFIFFFFSFRSIFFVWFISRQLTQNSTHMFGLYERFDSDSCARVQLHSWASCIVTGLRALLLLLLLMRCKDS